MMVEDKSSEGAQKDAGLLEIKSAGCCNVDNPPNIGRAQTRNGIVAEYIPGTWYLVGVMRLRLGRRVVNLSPLAQRTKTLPNGDDGRTSVVGREF